MRGEEREGVSVGTRHRTQAAGGEVSAPRKGSVSRMRKRAAWWTAVGRTTLATGLHRSAALGVKRGASFGGGITARRR